MLPDWKEPQRHDTHHNESALKQTGNVHLVQSCPCRKSVMSRPPDQASNDKHKSSFSLLYGSHHQWQLNASHRPFEKRKAERGLRHMTRRHASPVPALAKQAVLPSRRLLKAGSGLTFWWQICCNGPHPIAVGLLSECFLHKIFERNVNRRRARCPRPGSLGPSVLSCYPPGMAKDVIKSMHPNILVMCLR